MGGFFEGSLGLVEGSTGVALESLASSANMGSAGEAVLASVGGVQASAR